MKFCVETDHKRSYKFRVIPFLCEIRNIELVWNIEIMSYKLNVTVMCKLPSVVNELNV